MSEEKQIRSKICKRKNFTYLYIHGKYTGNITAQFDKVADLKN